MHVTDRGNIALFTKEKTFDDFYGDGLNFVIEKNSLVYIEEISPEKQLSLAKEYTETLKQIMHEEKYKNY